MNLQYLTIDEAIRDVFNGYPTDIRKHLIEVSLEFYSITKDIDKSFKAALIIARPHLRENSETMMPYARAAYQDFKKIIEGV